ncbi:MAG: extracellular solute-binding protein [Caldilineaceae bacterium]|nr:extracellular solute-binding protein [Caldilineaceae bacterium]
MKKTPSFVLALLVILSLLLASCAGAGTAPAAQPAGNSEGGDGPVTIRIFSPQGPTVDLATNSFTLEAQEMFNIQFVWETTTMDGNAAKEKRQISLASGDYPDLFMLIPWVDQFTQLDLLKFGQQGVVIPLNDLIQEYAPNVQAALDNYPQFRAMAVAPDGNIYGLPQLIECYHCSYANKMWVNTKWREALGLEVPTTTEEFQAMLEAFKTQDPNGNGVADEVPLSGSIEDYGVRPIPYLMNGFAYDDDRTFLILNDGQVDTVANKPEWKEGLTYIKGLVDAGLIDQGAFTQNAESYKKIGDNAEAQLLGAGAGMHPAIFVTVGPEAPYGADYDAIPPLQGPRAQYATYLPNTVPGATFVLTNKASEAAQIAAIKLVDYMFTQEGQLRSHFGEEGVDWRRPEEGDVALNKEVEPIFAVIQQPADADPRNSSWGAMAQYFQPKSFRDGWVQSVDPAEYYNWPGYERRLQDATDLMAGKESPDLFPFWLIWPNPDTADAIAMQRQNITDYVNQNALAFVTGAQSLDSDWDAYVAGLEQLDLAGYLAAMQTAYDASQQ